MESFGTVVHKLRINRGLLLREVAAHLQIDPSFLSRVERNLKRARREHIQRLAFILQADENELLTAYLSDRITYALVGEDLAMEIIAVAEKKIRYLRSQTGQIKKQIPKNEAY